MCDSEDVESVENEEWIKICDNIDCKKVVFKRKNDDGTTYDSHELIFTNGNLNYLMSFPNLSEENIDEIIDSFSMPTMYMINDISITVPSNFIHSSDGSEMWFPIDGKSGGFAVVYSNASCKSEEEERMFLNAFCDDDRFNNQEWTEIDGHTAIKYHDNSNSTEYAFIEHENIYIFMFPSDCHQDVIDSVIQSVKAI